MSKSLSVETHHSTQTAAYLAWFSVTFFYLFQYILRVAPGVMINEIRSDFGMTAEQFSLLGAFYLYGYSFFQIPLGILIDRVGVRKTVFGGLLMCMGGSAIMALAQDAWVAQISRIFVGIGSGTAFMGSVKLAADQFEPGKRGFFMGATLTIGLFGALTAGKPLVLVMQDLGWRDTVLASVAAGLVILAFVFLFTPKHVKSASLSKVTARSVIDDVLDVMRNTRIMLYAICAIGVYTPISALADLWGTAFLMQKYNLVHAEAAQTSMMMYLGMAGGCLFMPWICEKYHKLNLGIQVCTAGMFITFGYILYGPVVSESSLTLLLILLGFFCGAEMICFTGAVRFTTAANSGITIGVVNTLNMLGGALLQQGIGIILDRLWTGKMTDTGIRAYGTQEFTTALSILMVVIGVCALISFNLNRKRFCDKAIELSAL